MADQRRWVVFALVSLLLHGAVVFLSGVTGDRRQGQGFEVSLVAPFAEERPVRQASPRVAKAPAPAPAASPSAPAVDAKPPAPQAGPSLAGSEPLPPAVVGPAEANALPAAAMAAAGAPAPATAREARAPGVPIREARAKGEGPAAGPGQAMATAFGQPGGPRFLHRELPVYPLLAKRRKLEGKVLLSVSLSEQGSLTGVEVVEASSEIFIPPSLEAVKRSRFAPATRNGVPVAAKALLPIRFTLYQEPPGGVRGDPT